jgi:hypothetical protein
MPSTAILDKKKQAVADLAEQIKNSPAGVIVNYEGISVENDTKLRKALRENGVTYKVVKNTLTSRACAEAGLNGISKDTCLNGMTAIAISESDPVIAAKVGREQKQVTLSSLFGKEHPFIVDRESPNYPKDSKWKIDNLVEWTPELQSTTSARNAAVMAAVTDDLEITLVTVWGHFDGGQGRSFNLTFVKENATKL